MDDDLNGTIDNGCPSAVQLVNESLSGLYGRIDVGDSTMNHAFGCPVGQVVSRILLEHNNQFPARRFALWCAPLLVVPDTGATPYSYTVEAGPVAAVPTYDWSAPQTGFEQIATCNLGGFVKELAVHIGDNGLVGLTLRCGRLVIVGDPSTSYSFADVGNESLYIGWSGAPGPTSIPSSLTHPIVTGFTLRSSTIGNGQRLRALLVRSSEPTILTIL